MSILSQQAKKQLGCVMHWSGGLATVNVPKTVTAAADAKQILPFAGAGIGMFDGTGDYLSIPSSVMNFGTGDFTIEYLIKRNVMGGFERTFGNYASFSTGTGSNFCVRFGSSSMNAVGYISGSGGSWSGDGGSVLYTHPDLINYHHIAFVRSGTTFKVYLNGVQTYSYTCGTQSLNTPSNPLIIGGWCTDGGEAANVNISEFRISSIARYTAAFTPPRRQLENDSNTRLLLHFIPKDSIVPLTDSSGNNLTITPTGTITQVDSPVSPVASNYAVTKFNGSSYVSTPVNTGDLIGISGNNWTIEMYALFTVLPVSTTTNTLLYMGTGDINRFTFMQQYGPQFGLGDGWLYAFNDSTSGLIRWQAIATPQLNTWYHIALVKTGLNLELYIDGQIQTKTTGTTLSANIPARVTYPLIIGKYRDAYYYLQGMLSEFRMSNTARYSGSSFVLPTTQFVTDANTKVLLHFDGRVNIIYDYSPSPKVITPYGDAKQLSSPCGSGVAYFDGNGDYLSCTTTDFQHTGNFTYEGWVWWNGSVPNDWPMIFDTRPSNASNSNSICANIHPSTYRLNFYLGGTNYYWGDTPLPSNRWVHIAIVRSNGVVYIYQNGIIGSGTCANSNTFSSATGIRIGANIGSCGWWPGYISDFKVSNGIARYTGSSFTLPIQPLRPDPNTKLLLHMDGAGAAFYDSSDPPGDNGFPILPDGVTVTPAGTFAIQKMKDGRNVYKFNGSTNYISISNNATLLMGSSSFTITCWIQLFSIPASGVSYIVWYGSDTQNYQLAVTSGGNINFSSYASSAYLWNINSGSGTIVINTWVHLAVVRNGSYQAIYLNAKQVGTTGSSSGTIGGHSNPFYISGCDYPYGTPNFITGNIKDLMIFKDKALSVDQLGAIMNETYIY